MTYKPHRYAERSVFRFVPVVQQVLTQHAKLGRASVKFNPLELNISLETAIARLRDAAHSLSSGLTTHPSIDVGTLSTVWPLYKVTSDGTHVLVVSRETEQADAVTIQTASTTASLAVLRTEDIRFVENLTAFALLFGQRLLTGQVDIVGDLSENTRHRIESEYDVAFIQDGQTNWHMI